MENLKKFCKEKSITFFFPISLVLSIVPLIVRVKDTNPGTEILEIMGTKAKYDLFSQNKAIALMFFCSIILLISILFFKYIFKKKDKVVNSIVILSFVFLFLSLLSSVFSSHRDIAFFGVYDRAEGFITIACYIILFIYSIYTFKSTENYKAVIIPILIIVFINAFLGIFQFAGYDLLKTNLGQVFANLDPSKVDASYKGGNLYGTLYHYNYVGSFATIVIPVIICSFFIVDDVFLKLLIMAGSISGIWLLFGSTSRAGIIGVCFSILFTIIIFSKQIFKNMKPVIIIICTLLVVFVGINFATGNKLFKRIPTLVSDGLSIFKNTSDFDYKEHVAVNNITYKDKDVVVCLPNNDNLTISFKENEYNFINAQGEKVNYEKNIDSKTNVKTLSTMDNRYSNISFRFGPQYSKTKDDGLLLFVNNKPAFMFITKDDNSIHLFNSTSKKDIDLEFPESFGFNGKESLASGRGYIWSRTIPLLKNCMFLGQGPDTFILSFPHNDLIGKLCAYGVTTEIVDKPHDLYLQIAYSNGFIALIAFLAIMIIYIVDSMKLYARKPSYEEKDIMGIASFLAVIGYLFTGIFNDSVISVAPVFWIIFGVGVAVNYMNRNNLKVND